MSRDTSMPSLLERLVSKYAKNAACHCLSVRPSLLISGIGPVGNEARICSAIRRHSARFWYL